MSKVLPFRRATSRGLHVRTPRAGAGSAQNGRPSPPAIPVGVRFGGLVPLPRDPSDMFGDEACFHFTMERPDHGWFSFALFLKSHEQTPCGSLPGNDAALAAIAGVDLQTWLRMRDGALMGWYECSDGRLYHPAVTENVLSYAGKAGPRTRSARKKQPDLEPA